MGRDDETGDDDDDPDADADTDTDTDSTMVWLHAKAPDAEQTLCGRDSTKLVTAKASWRRADDTTAKRCPSCVEQAPIRPARDLWLPRWLRPDYPWGWWTWRMSAGQLWVLIAMSAVLWTIPLEITWSVVSARSSSPLAVFVGLSAWTISPALMCVFATGRWATTVGPNGITFRCLRVRRLAWSDISSFAAERGDNDAAPWGVVVLAVVDDTVVRVRLPLICSNNKDDARIVADNLSITFGLKARR